MTTDVADADADAVEERRHAVAWDAAATTVRSRPRPAADRVAAAIRADAAATAAEELERALRSLAVDERERAEVRALADRLVDGLVGTPAGRVDALEPPASADAALELFDAARAAPDVTATAVEVNDVE